MKASTAVLKRVRRGEMKANLAKRILTAAGIAAFCLLGCVIARGQGTGAGTEQKPQMVEQAFKNVQLLKGVPVDEFMETMGFFAASTGLNCTECHTEESGSNWAKYADDTPLKNRARMMILMVQMINRTSFGGKGMVTCWTCHRGTQHPRVIPDLAVQYSEMPDTEPDEIVANRDASVDPIFNKYIEAVGGAQRASALTSFSGKGAYQGYETALEKVSVDVYAKTPDQRATFAHMADGDSIWAYDGQAGWLSAPETLRPFPLIPLTGDDLAGAKIDAIMSFSAKIKESLVDWRVGFPEKIDTAKEEVQVIQGRLEAGGLPVKLYFDSTSGLLLRYVRYSNSPVGVVPTQVDFSDYRDVDGVKMPYRWVVTWTDGRSTLTLSELRANVTIDAAKFGKPTPKLTDR
jgi:photosynthetic reaction center cytochrome c subunit